MPLRMMVARLARNITEPIEYFSAFGNFRGMLFEQINSEKIKSRPDFPMISLDNLQQREGFIEMSQLLLFDFGPSCHEEEELATFISPNGLMDEDSEYPLCVMVAINDFPLPNECQSNGIDTLRQRLEKYHESFRIFRDIYVKETGNYEDARIKMRAFYTLACIDVVLVFRTDCAPLINAFVRSLRRSHVVNNTYSIYSFSRAIGNSSDTKHLISKIKGLDSITATMLVKYKSKQNEMSGSSPQNQFKDELDRIIGRECYKHTLLAGSYHGLFGIDSKKNTSDGTIPAGALFSEYFANNWPPNCVEPLRIGIEFDSESIFEIESELDQMARFPERPLPIRSESESKLYDQLLCSFMTVRTSWDAIASTAGSQWDHAKELNDYSRSISNILAQYVGFFKCLDAEAQKGVNPEIMYMLDGALSMLIILFNQYKKQLNSDGTIFHELPILHAKILKTTHSIFTTIGDFMRNLVHTHIAFLEEGSLFGSDITGTTKLVHGYYWYVTELCNKLMNNPCVTRRVGDIKSIACFIRLDAMKESANATEHFSASQKLQQEAKVDELHSLISIGIAHHNAFKFHQVRRALTHECLHHVGDRNRVLRASAVTEVLCHWLCDRLLFIIEPSSLYQELPSDVLPLIHDFINCMDLKEKREELRENKLNDLVKKSTEYMKSKLNKAFDAESDSNQLNWALLDFLNKALNAFFTEMLSGNTMYGVNKHFDIIVEAVNHGTELREQLLSHFMVWSSRQNNDGNDISRHSAAYNFVQQFAYDRWHLIQEELRQFQEFSNSLLGGTAIDTLIYHNLSVETVGDNAGDLDTQPKLQRRNIDELNNTTKNEIDIANRVSMRQMIDIICSATCEAFCDIGTLLLLSDSTVKDYCELLRLPEDLELIEWKEIFRIYLVFSVVDTTAFTKDPQYITKYETIKMRLNNELAYMLIPIVDYLKTTTSQFCSLKNDALFGAWETNQDAFTQLFKWAQELRVRPTKH